MSFPPRTMLNRLEGWGWVPLRVFPAEPGLYPRASESVHGGLPSRARVNRPGPPASRLEPDFYPMTSQPGREGFSSRGTV